MGHGKITITENNVIINYIDGNIWLSSYEIAKLFDVFLTKISSNIRSIQKSDVFWKDDICFNYHYSNGNSINLYNLEMITALAFRIHSPKTDIFRKWLMKQAVTVKKEIKNAPTVIVLDATSRINS
ncbi:MAG: protein-tyrosine kinase [Candidatus Azobacteroides sp.]|nr:protein-tyrosine kinase [Candidatus Azobacteroides sp.]